VSAVEELSAVQSRPVRNGHGADRFQVTFDGKGNLSLPEIPGHDDQPGLCAWLTGVFNLNVSHPITGGKREGLRGPEGHVVLARAGAAPIRFEPASKINSAAKLIETLSWRMIETDGAVHALKSPHCRQIAHVVRMLCGASEAMSDEQETEAIVGTFMQSAQAVEGHTTYGTSGQRYEAAVALRRAVDEVTGRSVGPARYLIDENTGEMVMAVSDLQDAARRHVGSSLPHGWLDGRMEALDWARITLAGFGQPGRAGRRGPHARINAYRGILRPVAEDTDDPVNT
jgi:hypothetical protein